ncbi:MAG: DEAD/DEAH box helicase [Rickettsiales bacterium]|jgi:transcription-repair coupling factor (superfamily II helicase)|nr:DEAD/DEAH box helicase [Rickettsiales bacterium]
MLEQLLREDINIGDVIVHRQYGLGILQGLETVYDEDVLKIEYANKNFLYIPVRDIELITKYGEYEDGVTKLDFLSKVSWITKRENARKDIEVIAKELIKIAAKRHLSKAPILVADANEYKEFCDEFEFEETPDQLQAIRDVEADLKKGIPADRLVCGDVGFGKTEVALRASFIVSNCGMQVALICPTTLLCRQHYNVFSKRYEKTGIRIGMISRFTTNHNGMREEVERGNIDIIIGTHSLLNFKFKQFGMLIVDEEQRFGVKQKEKLKEMRDGVHLLTLSATPIPRTLQMAMTGIKDLSILTTPPKKRQSVETKVGKMDEKIFENAISYEIERGGKVLIVVPRIADIVRIEENMKGF